MTQRSVTELEPELDGVVEGPITEGWNKDTRHGRHQTRQRYVGSRIPPDRIIIRDLVTAEPDTQATPADLAAAELRIVRLSPRKASQWVAAIKAGYGVQCTVTNLFRTKSRVTADDAWVRGAGSAGRWATRDAALSAARRYIDGKAR